jgi:hypothetical protein
MEFAEVDVTNVAATNTNAKLRPWMAKVCMAADLDAPSEAALH